MRSRVVVLLILCASDGASQGLVVFDNRVGDQVNAPVYDIDPHNPAFAQYGAGQVYNGGALAGTGFTAQLFGGPTNIPCEQLSALSPVAVFRTGVGAGYVVPPSRAVAVAAVPEGERAKVQLRAWNNRGGAISNWQQAVADPRIARGASLPVITPPLGSLFTAPPNLISLQSFSLAQPIVVTSPRRGTDGRFRFNYNNPTALPYGIEASTDLGEWTSAGSIGVGGGTYTDAAVTNHSRRFYRVVPCP